MNRREFIQLSSLLPTLSLSSNLFAKPNQANTPILLLVELKGANDALNTLVPIADDNYRKLRPQLALNTKNTINLNDGFAAHKALQPLMKYWGSGEMAWLHGLGYDNPNRSHFRSIEIWESGSDSDVYDTEGWLSKLYPTRTNNLSGVVIGSDAGPLTGETLDTLVMEDAKSYEALAKRLKAVRAETTNSALSRVLDVQNNVQQNAKSVINILNGSQGSKVAFPKNKFGKQIEQAAHLIRNNLGASIYKVELGGFDTHRNQLKTQDRLLKQLAQGLSAFAEEMKHHKQWDNVMVMTYSEFGRRAAENRSGGTDHGTAAAHFVLGGRVRGGFHGTAPRLDQLDNNGDLIYTSDFRSLYHTVATQWLKRPSPWTNFAPYSLIHS
ncbi:DUF1501 domain-containing protein [Leucothrix sargassi]|nr:DUF1501 domain-containing protein [Leucothrix sargassi]